VPVAGRSGVDDIDLATALAGAVMIEIKHGGVIEELLVLLVQAAKTPELPCIQGDYQVECCIMQGLLHTLNAGQEREVAGRSVRAGGHTDLSHHCQDMRAAERAADTIAVGPFVRDQQDSPRWFDQGQRSLYKLRIKL